MDLDLWDCFGRKIICLITKEIRYDNMTSGDLDLIEIKHTSILLKMSQIVRKSGLSVLASVNQESVMPLEALFYSTFNQGLKILKKIKDNYIQT